MVPVVFEIEQVVQQIDARRAQAEREKGQDGGDDRGDVRQLMRRQQRDEDQQILEPLMQAQRFRPRPWPAGAFVDDALDIALLARCALHTVRWIDHICTLGGGPNGDIVVRISRVIEALLAELGDQSVALAMRGQIDRAIRGEGLVEKSQMIGNRVRVALMAGSSQYEGASRGALRFEPFDYRGIVGQNGDIDIGRFGEMSLQARFALARKPQKRLVKPMRGRLGERKAAFNQDIRSNQGTVEVDNERFAAHALGRRRTDLR
ncbi:hypothetical protein OKW37_001529 [Paraburkholderia sp. MM5482-R2]